VRVLHVFKTFFPDTVGGIEEVIHQLARDSGRHGIQADVFTLTGHGGASEIAADGYRVYRARRELHLASTGLSLSAFPIFARLVRGADLVHYHFPWPFMDLLHFTVARGKPSVLTYHSDIVRQRFLAQLYRPMMTRFLRSVDAIVATSPNYLATSAVLQAFRGKVRVIPIGVDLQRPDRPASSLVASWVRSSAPRFFLFIGALRYYKGLHILLKAARDAPFPILIVGAGPIEAELKAEAARGDLKNVHFLGHVSAADKLHLLANCHGVVFPSHLRSEAFGVSLVEGAMCGKPLISSEIGTGTSFINVDNKTGLVVPPGDPHALRQALEALWRDPARAAKLGANARARFERHFTAKNMVDGYARLYAEVLTARSPFRSINDSDRNG